jgi:hypothetical protein
MEPAVHFTLGWNPASSSELGFRGGTSPGLPVRTIAVAKEGKRRGELDHPLHR